MTRGLSLDLSPPARYMAVMPIYETYSRRKRRAEQSEPDVYVYDKIPYKLRIQIRRVLERAIGPFYDPPGSYFPSTPPPNNNEDWSAIHSAMCDEMGRMSLGDNYANAMEACITFLEGEQDIDDLLTFVEFGFRWIDRIMGDRDKYDRKRRGVKQNPANAIKELNIRFREAGVGYQFEGGQIIRVDSQLMHAEVVLPALHFLSGNGFAGPNDEFLAAHAHYRAGEYKDCVIDANNALESTMKAICDLKGWTYNKGATAGVLLKVLRENSLFPDYLDNSFDQLIATLKSGLPQVRNEAGGHGQGAQPKQTPDYVAGYALHLAAAKILLMAKALDDTL